MHLLSPTAREAGKPTIKGEPESVHVRSPHGGMRIADGHKVLAAQENRKECTPSLVGGRIGSTLYIVLGPAAQDA
jgi:hypothetical protein